MFDALSIKKEGERINKKMYLCKDCTVLLTLSGSMKDTFIISLSPEVDVKCDLCKTNQARFLVVPYEQGITICDRCLEERGSKHAWHRFKVVDEGEHLTCDLCFRKGAKKLIPTPREELPKALKERKLGRDDE